MYFKTVCRVLMKLLYSEADRSRPSVQLFSEVLEKCKCIEINLCDRYSCIYMYIITTKLIS